MYSMIGTILVVITILIVNIVVSTPKIFGANDVYAFFLLLSVALNSFFGLAFIIYGISENKPILFGGIMLIVLSVYQLSIFHREY